MALARINAAQDAASVSDSESEDHPQEQQARSRRGSFSFLTRARSHEVLVARSPAGRNMLRSKKVRDQEERRRQEQQVPMVPNTPPKLPTLPTIGSIGEAAPSDHSIAIISGRGHMYSPSPPPTNNFSRPKQQQQSRSESSMPSMSSVGSLSSPNSYRVPLPPMPGALPRAESMVSRGRESYAHSLSASLQSPRKMRRRKEPEAFKHVPFFHLPHQSWLT
jgi:hypothetical protein